MAIIDLRMILHYSLHINSLFHTPWLYRSKTFLPTLHSRSHPCLHSSTTNLPRQDRCLLEPPESRGRCTWSFCWLWSAYRWSVVTRPRCTLGTWESRKACVRVRRRVFYRLPSWPTWTGWRRWFSWLNYSYLFFFNDNIYKQSGISRNQGLLFSNSIFLVLFLMFSS